MGWGWGISNALDLLRIRTHQTTAVWSDTPGFLQKEVNEMKLHKDGNIDSLPPLGPTLRDSADC